MDESDGDRTSERPFDEGLTPAMRRAEGERDADDRPDASVTDIEELIGPPQTLESEIQGVWAIQSAVSAAILGVIAAVAFSVLSVGGAWIGGVVFVLGTALGIALSVLRYRIWTYQVRSDSLYLRRGVVTRVNTVAPYVRIQHVDTRRGPIERVFGLATTVVYTAGSRGADVSIPGLTPERAADLQARLKQLAIAAEGDDAV